MVDRLRQRQADFDRCGRPFGVSPLRRGLSLDEIQQQHRESSASTRYPDDVLERFDFLAASTSGSDRKL
jgi:hypothetical protein